MEFIDIEKGRTNLAEGTYLLRVFDMSNQGLPDYLIVDYHKTESRPEGDWFFTPTCSMAIEDNGYKIFQYMKLPDLFKRG